ncbi:MAG: ATP-binding protein [Victivallaceae bacterium]|nr:ATP-binding protein [Victivallaceae bacterium]
MLLKRTLENKIKQRLFTGKAIILYGPRQSGKTTLVRQITKDESDSVLLLNGDEPDVRNILSEITSTRLKAFFGKKRLVVIDEAQRIPNIGLTMKLITDQLPDIQLIATGSSAFELADKTSEPLTGRKYEFHLYPFAFEEMAEEFGLLEERRMLKHRLVYGAYPEIVTHIGQENELLRLLAGSYLYKDLLMLEDIKKPTLLEKIIQALALQLGSEVSTNELGNLVGANRKTVEKYIDLLVKSYVIFVLPAFSRNARNEIRKGRKVYFYDNGIRNAVLGNFNPIESRTDVGALWENYLISERLKVLANHGKYPRQYFWRTITQQEVDYLEEGNGKLFAWEFKWNLKAKHKIPNAFITAYPETQTEFISPDNYDEFLSV